MATFEKLVLVTRKTRLAELLERLPTKGRAKFYLKQQNLDFDDYDEEDATYQRAVDQVQSALHGTLKVQVLDRALLPTFLFSEKDVVVTLGQDGLVANAAKYVDGVLLPFAVSQARAAVERVLSGRAAVRQVTLAEARLRDGQRLLAFNDLYVGAQTHVSARYHLRAAQGEEKQSSSGVIVSTGAGSTGWLSSVFNMASNVSRFLGTDEAEPLRLQWEDPRLIWVVREPFVSRHSSARFTAGYLEPGASLSLESLMPQGGVIFGDGMEKDFLAFNSGAVAELHAASVRARLVAA
jgi:hypothetical protein